MPAYYRLTFLPAGRTQDFAGSRGNYYRLANGAEIDLHSRPVWCEQCAKVTHGEEIESVQAIDQRIADLERLAAEIRIEMKRPPLPPPDAPGDSHQQEQIAELKLRRVWRLQRSSPSKCLVCGSTAIVPLEHGKQVRIAGGTVRCDCVGMCSTNFNEWRYSAEGDLIEKGQPTYWHFGGVT
jgi:hypothetical protein